MSNTDIMNLLKNFGLYIPAFIVLPLIQFIQKKYSNNKLIEKLLLNPVLSIKDMRKRYKKRSFQRIFICVVFFIIGIAILEFLLIYHNENLNKEWILFVIITDFVFIMGTYMDALTIIFSLKRSLRSIHKLPVCYNPYDNKRFIVLKISKDKVLTLSLHHYEHGELKNNIDDHRKLISLKGSRSIKNINYLTYCYFHYVKY